MGKVGVGAVVVLGVGAAVEVGVDGVVMGTSAAQEVTETRKTRTISLIL